jgi:hypothetical protein
VLLAVLATVVACGQAAEPEDGTTGSLPSSPTTTSTTSPISTASSVPTSKASTTTPVAYAYSVAALGLHPGVSLTNSGALGSGCVPGPGSLPDGAWFGWVNAASDASLEFDLA